MVLYALLCADAARALKLFRGCQPGPGSCKDHLGLLRMRQDHTKLCVCPSQGRTHHTSNEPQQAVPPSLGTRAPHLPSPATSVHMGTTALCSPRLATLPHLGTLAPYLSWPIIPPVYGEQHFTHHGTTAELTCSLATREPKAQCM